MPLRSSPLAARRAGRLVVALLGLVPAGAAGQDLLVTRDGVRLTGQVVGESPTAVTLRAGGWELPVPREGLRALVRPGRRPRLFAAERAEDEALLHESRGRAVQAFQAWSRATAEVLGALERGEVAAAPARPLLEVWLRRAELAAGRAGLRLAAVGLFQRVVAHPGPCPWTRDLARACLARALRRAGEAAQALTCEAELGLLTTWFLAGPFDNERGTGTTQPHPPLTQPFAPDASWPGKTRPVGWRPQPVAAPPGGLIDLDELYRPADQGLVYAITWLHAEAETPVALRLGSDEALRVWLDRAPVHAFAGRRPFAEDQDQVGLVLHPGWNELLLQVGDQTGAWAFRARLTAPRGGPATGVRAATLAEIAAVPSSAPGAAPRRVEVVRHGAADLEAMLAAEPDDWRGWAHLAWLRWAHQDHDRGERPDRDAVLKAVKLRPADPHLQVLLAQASEFEAEHSVQKEENPRRLALEEALRLDPDHALARWLLASYYWTELSAGDRARQLIQPAVLAEPGFWEAGLLLADLDEALGLEPLGRARRLDLGRRAAAAVARGELEGRPIGVVEALLADARERDDGAAELALRAEVCALEPGSAWARQSLADALWRAGRSAAALQASAEAQALDPFDPDLRVSLAELLAAAGRLDEAAAALEQALGLCPEEKKLLLALARLEDRRGGAARAEELFARARELDPNDGELREYLEYRARNEAQSAPFEAAWVLDPAPLLAGARAVPLDPRRTHRFLLKQAVVRLQPDGRSSEWSQELIRIESPEGARALQTYGAGYHSDQRLTFQLGRVHRRAGGHEDVQVGTWRDQSGGGEFGRRLSGGVRFPPLVPGDVIEVRYRTDDLVQGFFGDYFGTTVAFQDGVALDRMRWVLLAPPGKQLYWNTPRLERVGGTSRQVAQPDGSLAHVFEAERVPAFDPEPNQPWQKELLPLVQVSTFRDWDAFARWYWGLVAPTHESDPDIKARVEELCRGASTDEEKIRRVYEFVVSEVRYNAAWEFGVHGFKPYHAPRIYARRFGDCKDKATLINVMLREVGIRSHPVLIFGEDVRGTEDLTLPLIGHFNHCISWVEHGGPDGLFLDGTAEHHPFRTLPSMDYGAKVVIITPERALVKEIPTPPAAENTIREKHLVKLKDTGGAELQSSYEANGVFGVVLRQLLSTEGRRAEVLEPRWGQAYTGAQVTKVTCSDLADLSQPVKVELAVELPRVLQGATTGRLEVQEVRSWLFDLIYLRGRKLSGLAADEKREQDVVLPIPAGVDETVIYELPPGHSLKSVPAPQEIKTPFGSYQRRYEQRGRQLVARRVLQVDTRRIPAAAYEEFRSFLGAIERAEGERPSLTAGDGAQ